MNEFQLIAAILQNLNNRLVEQEQDSRPYAECRELIERLGKVIPGGLPK